MLAGKRIQIRDAQVLTWTYQRIPVSEMARRLNCSRNTIRRVWLHYGQVFGVERAGLGGEIP
jgi:hypothetical protein